MEYAWIQTLRLKSILTRIQRDDPGATGNRAIGLASSGYLVKQIRVLAFKHILSVVSVRPWTVEIFWTVSGVCHLDAWVCVTECTRVGWKWNKNCIPSRAWLIRHFISQSIHLARMDTWINFGSNGDAWFDNWVVNAGFTGSDKYGSVVEAGDVQGPAWLPGVRVISVREPVAWWDTFPTWLTSRLSGWTQLVLDVVTCKQGNERWAGVVYESGLRLRYQHGVSVLTVFQKKSNANLSV